MDVRASVFTFKYAYNAECVRANKLGVKIRQIFQMRRCMSNINKYRKTNKSKEVMTKNKSESQIIK